MVVVVGQTPTRLVPGILRAVPAGLLLGLHGLFNYGCQFLPAYRLLRVTFGLVQLQVEDAAHLFVNFRLAVQHLITHEALVLAGRLLERHLKERSLVEMFGVDLRAHLLRNLFEITRERYGQLEREMTTLI